MLGFAVTITFTFELEGRQELLEIVQRNVFIPTLKPETELVGEVESAINPVPATSVQIPVPITGILADKEVVFAQIF